VVGVLATVDGAELAPQPFSGSLASGPIEFSDFFGSAMDYLLTVSSPVSYFFISLVMCGALAAIM
jgi:hypothetical protein